MKTWINYVKVLINIRRKKKIDFKNIKFFS